MFLFRCQDLLAVSLIIPLVPSHVRAMGGSHICVGLLGSLYAGFQLGSGPLMVSWFWYKIFCKCIYHFCYIYTLYWFQGSLSDIKGRKTILVMTLLMCSFAYIVTGLTNSIIVILIARAFLGMFESKFCCKLFIK